jgi:hypothetical protein
MVRVEESREASMAIEAIEGSMDPRSYRSGDFE